MRLTYLIGWRVPWPVGGDAYYYHHGANLLADGRGYVHPYSLLRDGSRLPGADHPPGFLTVLAGFSWLGLRSFLQHQVIACVLGAAGVAAMGVAGRRIAGERVGLLVAGLAAVDPNIFNFDPLVVSETLVVGTTAAVLVAGYRWWDRPGAGAAAVFGVAIGVASLVRPEAVLLGPLIAVPLLWFRRRSGRAGPLGSCDAAGTGGRWWAQAGAAGLAATAVVAPWAGYNLARFTEPVLLSAQFDQTLAAANCDTVYHGAEVGYWSSDCSESVEHLVGEGDASVKGRGYRAIALRYVRANAGRVPHVVAARVGRTFGVYAPGEQVFLDHVVDKKAPVLGRVGLVAWYGIAVAGAAGVVGLRRAGRPVFPLVAVVAGVAATVAVVYGNTRFRLPAELALMVPAAVTADAALVALRHRLRSVLRR